MLRRFYGLWLLFQDPPAHTRLRGLLGKAFTPRIQTIVDELLAAAQARGALELIHDLAYPLPVIVISELLVVPPTERDRFKQWCDDVLVSFSLGTAADLLGAIRQGAASVAALTDYFHTLIERRRGEPAEDLLSALVHAEERGVRLSDDEVIANCAFLLFAGHETTTNLIGNGMLVLVLHPEQMQRLLDDPELLDRAIEEMLRFDSAVQFQVRVAGEDVEFGGKRIARGERMWLMQGAANRDPARFPTPIRST